MADTLNTPVLLKTPIADKATSDNIMDLPLEYNEETDYGIGGQDIGFPTECRLPIRYSDGTPGKGRPPKMQIMNMMLKTMSSHNFYAQNGGTYTFSQTVSDAIGGYPAGAILSYKPTTGSPYLVQSLIDNNTNNFVLNPALIDNVHWKKINATSEELDNYVNLTGNQSIDGVKTFLKKIWSYTDDYNDSRRVCVLRGYEQGNTDESIQIAGTDCADKNGVEISQNLIIKESGGIVRNGQWMKSLIPGSNVSAWGCMTEARLDGSFHTYAVNPPADSNDTHIATTSWVRANTGGGVPVGTILPYGGTTAPAGFLLCNGGAISRTTYANLFSVIGTDYGDGDGNTTFNLPNMVKRYLSGNDTGYGNQTLPNISGAISSNNWAGTAGATSALYPSGTGDNSSPYGRGSNVINFLASRSNATYGAKNKYGETGYVTPYTTYANFIIKY